MFGTIWAIPRPRESKSQPYPRCTYCGAEWHGLPTEVPGIAGSFCGGSFDTQHKRPKRLTEQEP